MKKEITIIIVSYNKGNCLKECIDSCLSQKSIDNTEIIIGDDGSSDGSIDIIKQYADEYPDTITYFVMERIITEPIIGSIRASNVIKTALQKASGNFIYLLSCDDYICDKDFIYNGSKILNQNPEIKAVAAKSFKKVFSDGKEIVCTVKPYAPQIYWTGVYNHISCYIFRKDYAIANLLDRFCDDTGLEYSFIGKWKYIDSIAFNYRQIDNSIMHNSDLLELNLLEMMLFQDCLNRKKLAKIFSLSRFYRPLHYMFKHRNEITQSKYAKYISNSEKYANNVISEILEYDDFSILKKMTYRLYLCYGAFVTLFFKIIRKIS
jgi:glycosyltransferase involved in cell wall biosynthesis